MAVFTIPNPTRSLTVDFPLDKIKKGIQRIGLITSKYKVESSNEAFHQYRINASEALSFGSYIDVHLSAVDSKTQISIEVSRKIGTFDKPHEINSANDHIVNIINLISKATLLSDEDAQNIIDKSNADVEKRKNRKFKKRYIFFGLLIVYLIYAFFFYKP